MRAERRLFAALAASAILLASSTACNVGDPGTDGWKSVGPEGRTVFSLAVDPDDSKTIYAGDARVNGGDKREDSAPDDVSGQPTRRASSPRFQFVSTTGASAPRAMTDDRATLGTLRDLAKPSDE